MKAALLLPLSLLASAASIPLHADVPHSVTVLDDVPIAQRVDKRHTTNSIIARGIPILSPIIQLGVNYGFKYKGWNSTPVKTINLNPTVDPKAKKVVIRYGPYNLKGTKESGTLGFIQMDLDGTSFVRTLKGMPPNAAILTAKSGLEYEDGSPAVFSNGIYVHHILIADINKPQSPFALCPGQHDEKVFSTWMTSYIMEALGAGLIEVGNDANHDPNYFGAQNGQAKAAFMTGKDDTFLLQAEIVNYNPTNRSIYLAMELEYMEQQPKDWMDSSTIVVSATGCGNPLYKPPPGATKYNHTSAPFIIKHDGYIVNARGHLHDGGTALQLLKNDEIVCDSKPTYGRLPGANPESPETIVGMSWCYDSIRIKKGDLLTLKTFYDTDLHPLLKGGQHVHGHGKGSMEGGKEMGIMTTNFAWDGGSVWS